MARKGKFFLVFIHYKEDKNGNQVLDTETMKQEFDKKVNEIKGK